MSDPVSKKRKPFKHTPSVRSDMLGPIIGREQFVYRDSEPTKGDGNVPAASAAFHAEISKRTENLRERRSAIKKPSGKLTSRERNHLHSFAFTSEQVRSETSKRKKHS